MKANSSIISSMKKNNLFLILSGFCLIITLNLSAQVAINTDGNPPATSAMLDVSSTTKGFLAPKMTTLQRTAIASPAEGLLVYDTDLGAFYYFNSGSWIGLGG